MILITGGTGLVGEHLSKLLLAKGYEIGFLSRKKQTRSDGIQVYEWDIENEYIEEEAIMKATHIVHLAGAGIVEKSWTEKRKKLLIDSRVRSAKLLMSKIGQHKPLSFIAASGIGYYPSSADKVFTETDSPADDFLAEICKVWEESSADFSHIGIRTVILRIGLVLSHEGGALPEMMRGMQLGAGAYFGSGKAWYSWIHIEDLSRMILFAIENPSMQGVFNAVAPNPVRSKDFSAAIIRARKQKSFLLPIPNFFAHLLLGERKEVLLRSQYTSSKKIQEAGYSFLFDTLDTALNDLL
jgi:uncharacterized protein (TIGR01777 family)